MTKSQDIKKVLQLLDIFEFYAKEAIRNEDLSDDGFNNEGRKWIILECLKYVIENIKKTEIGLYSKYD